MAGSASQSLGRVKNLGFDTVLAESDAAVGCSPAFARACESRGLSLFLDIDLIQLNLHHPLVAQFPESFSIRRIGDAGYTVDPRHPSPGKGCGRLRSRSLPEPLIDWWRKQIAQWIDSGVRGFRLLKPASTPAALREEVIEAATRHGANRLTFIADTTGEQRDAVLRLSGFDHTVSSLPWWDGRASWLVEEYEALSRVAAPIAQVESPARLPPASSVQRCGRLAIGAVSGSGILVPLTYLDRADEGEDCTDLDSYVREINAFVAKEELSTGALVKLTGASSPLTILLRGEAPDIRYTGGGLVALINPDPIVAVEAMGAMLGGLAEFNQLTPLMDSGAVQAKLGPGQVRLFRAKRSAPIVVSGKPEQPDVNLAADSRRVVIAGVSPAVDDGTFPAKAIVGEQITVEADVFTDGHTLLAAELIFRSQDQSDWQRARMHALPNDRWTAVMPLTRVGRHEFAIEAWIDGYGGFARDLTKKHEAGVDITLELQEGQQMLAASRNGVSGVCGNALEAILRGFETLPQNDRAALLIAAETVETMRRADSRRFKSRSKTYVVDAERTQARFSSWYELFPRSESGDAARHGTFRDVMQRLPAIRKMGFDVLYFPPIHPVGKTNRKGRNNALKADACDPGSVYAIGSAEGGHDAIHPDLGTLQDFRALVSAAHQNGLEIALDFAVQASPDHPWLKQHPGWFDWRPDGSIKYAENPPKKYEDIVNVDFYAADAVPGLWRALRDVVLFWIRQGVKIFRVDNPHTKPFPFWQWLIADVRGTYPDVIFLSEAFTRPKVMYQLAKLGFSQSYTYFIWRNTKQELMEYMTELTTPPVSDFFRPNFFVTTPDINPYFLQTSGRAGFLIRAALASTLSGLWGMYSGYELCESASLPGREEYLDSEKYEIRLRNWNAPGNIVAEIAQLNRLRKAEPALQSHIGLTFYKAFNDNILYFGKTAPGQEDRVLVAISLDPHNSQEADFEIPLWEWGRADHEALDCENLLHGGHWVWRGKIQHMRLTPEMPYAIWRVKPTRDV